MPRVFYLRHAQSTANVGLYTLNAPLTSTGQLQAFQLQGHFNYVLCSPLTRARKTLDLSQITYDHLLIVHKIRERGDSVIPDFNIVETTEDFSVRVGRFEVELRELCRTCDRDDVILIVGHGYFYTYWIGSELHNAQMIEIPPSKYMS